MRLLLDTHTLFWALLDEKNLSPAAATAIADEYSEVFVSIASVWELAIKVGRGKWPGARSLLEDFEGVVQAENFRVLPISISHVRAAGLTTSPHRDPFDRLLVAQAITEGLTIVTVDPNVRALAPCLW